jgi:hypothetical protein
MSDNDIGYYDVLDGQGLQIIYNPKNTPRRRYRLASHDTKRTVAFGATMTSVYKVARARLPK